MNSTKYIAIIAALAIAIQAPAQTAAPVSMANYGDGTSVTAKEIAPGIIKVTHTVNLLQLMELISLNMICWHGR